MEGYIVMDSIVTLQRLQHIKDLLARITYKNWSFLSDIMGNGCYLQTVLDVCDEGGERWKGRKWYVSNFMTDPEIVNTAFLAVMTAEEHETRESFLFDDAAIYGPHLSLEAMKQNANTTEHRQD